MKKILLFLFSMSLTFPVWANMNVEPLLDKVTLQLQAEQWVTTKTALVNVDINASVTDQGIDKIQVDAMQKLSQLSSQGEWHVVSFNRQEDKSGLESVHIVAEARLPQADLANLRGKAKAISKPGVTFTIASVTFTPSESEFRQANTILRDNLYQQAKVEIENLNKLYPDQKYYLHQIDFSLAPPVIPVAQNMAYARMAQAQGEGGSSSPLTVGNKVQMQATVVLASMPTVVAQYLSHSNN